MNENSEQYLKLFQEQNKKNKTIEMCIDYELTWKLNGKHCVVSFYPISLSYLIIPIYIYIYI